MIRTKIQIEDADKVYNIGDTVRIKMKPRYPDKPELASEYIGKIIDIKDNLIILYIDDLDYTKEINVNNIDRMRLARDGEDFNNTFNFDD